MSGLSINAALRAAVTTIVPICVPHVYTGSEKEYCAFNYTESPVVFADSHPGAMRYLIQLHWVCPLNASPFQKKKALKDALVQHGFTYPEVTDLSDQSSQRYVFECEYVDGDV